MRKQNSSPPKRAWRSFDRGEQRRLDRRRQLQMLVHPHLQLVAGLRNGVAARPFTGTSELTLYETLSHILAQD